MIRAVLLASCMAISARAEPVLSLAGTLPASGDYGLVLSAIDGLGAKATSLTLFWDDLEREGRYVADPDWPAIAEAVYPARGLALHLTISVIDTVADRRPDDLRAFAWDDPRVAARFARFVDEVLSRMPRTRLLTLVIGNEVDGHLAGADWERYGRFFDAARRHVRTARPDLPVSVTLTWPGLRDLPEARALAMRGDTLSVTWYPSGPGFDFGAPVDAGAELDAMIRLAAPRPVDLAEIGFPSAGCGSSPARQGDVLSAILTEATARDAVRLVQLVWSHDIAASEVAEYAGYYGVPDPCFAAYLGSLGLRTADDVPKPAFDRLAAR